MPANTTVAVGQTFDLTLEVRAGTSTVDGAAAFLNFDPAVLQVVSVTAGGALPVPIMNQFDNTTGSLDYSAGTFSGFPSGTFTLATVRFSAVGVGSAALVMFNSTPPRRSDVTFGGVSLLGILLHGTVTVVDTATLAATVQLQGRPSPPDPRWAVPLTVTLTSQGGSGVDTGCATTTDQNGAFVCGGIVPGTYLACAKHSHTLRTCQTVSLVAGTNTVSFGTLPEGDANDDNCVTLVDFSVLVTTFGKCNGDVGYDSRADFNGDGCVTLIDFSLLVTNFSQCGQTPTGVTGDGAVRPSARATSGETVRVRLTSPAKVRAGQVFEVRAVVEPDGRPVDGAAVYLDFDPRVLEVVGVTPGKTLGVELQRGIAPGAVDYAAATFGDFPRRAFTLATVTFRARRVARATALTLSEATPRASDVTSGGRSVRARNGGRTALRIEAVPGLTASSQRRGA